MRFLQDLSIAARGSDVRGLPASPQRQSCFRGNAGTAYAAAFRKTPLEEVQALVNVWNQCAFERRKVRVTLHARVDARGRRAGYDLLVQAL